MIHISNYLNKVIPKQPTCQEVNKSFSHNSHSNKISKPDRPPLEPILFPQVNKEIQIDPEYFFRNLSLAEQSMLNALFYYYMRYGVVVPTQTTLARKAGITRSYANTIIKRFVQWGILNKGYRHMRPCFYNISEFFASPHMRSRLSSIFSSLKFIAFFALANLCSTKSHPTKLTQGKYRTIRKEYIYNKYRQTGSILEPFSQRMYGDNPISLEIRAVTDALKLTKWGQIRLSAFPDEAIAYAKEKLGYAKKLDDPFNWFFKVCLTYCSENDIIPDWVWMAQLAKAYNMPENSPMVITKEKKAETEIPKAVKTTPKIQQEHDYDIFEHKDNNPVIVVETTKKHNPQEDKEFILKWLESEEARVFAKFIGAASFEKFVANRLAPFTESQDDE